MSRKSEELLEHEAKQVVKLHVLEGKTLAETAKTLGRTVRTVSNVKTTGTYNEMAIKAMEELGCPPERLAKELVKIIKSKNTTDVYRLKAISQAVNIFGLEAPKEEIHTIKTYTDEMLRQGLEESRRHYCQE